MAQAAYPATVKENSTVINGINSYELPYKMDDVDTTSFSQTDPGVKTYTLTLLGAQIKMSGFRITTDTGQNALLTAFLARTSVPMEFKPNGGVETHTMDCLVTGFSVKADVSGVDMLDVDLLMNSAVTIATS